MLSRNIGDSVLTIGNRSDIPDGGISQVLYSYRHHVFQVFKNIVNYKKGNYIYKFILTLCSFVQTFFVLLIDRDIKIVHIHTASDNGFKRNILFVNLASLLGKKVVLHIHSGRFNDYYERNKQQVEKVFSKCDVVIALTRNIKEFYEKMGCKNVFVINNIIESPTVEDDNLDDHYIHYLYLGVITRTKGIYDLLDVIIEHKDDLYGKFILHVGGNKETEQLQSIIKDNNLEEIVKFEGWVSGMKKTDLFNKCDVFILPSYTEGLPISILEAQSYGLFTVATNVGGIPEIVNEYNGILFTPQDKEALFKIIMQLDSDRSFRKNRSKIRENSKVYEPEYVCDQLEALYSDLLKQ